MKNEPSTPKSGLAAAVRKICRTGFLLPAVLGMFPGPASQADDVTSTNSTPALLTMSLEQLMSIKVTSVSKKEEALSQSAAAVSVITQDDIRRSGATTIPDALRLAPGVDVGRVDAHEWAVGVRGLNDTFASSLLTLIDGRSIYSPLFSGTFWQAQDVVMEDIDRIGRRNPGGAGEQRERFRGICRRVRALRRQAGRQHVLPGVRQI
jgi:iron complex outermembrane receptor protein